MGGDPTKATIWPDADVYVAPLGTAAPANAAAAWPGAWDLVGLLDGDAGFTQARSEEVNDRFAWGAILVRTTRKNFKLTLAFTALEDNDVTRALIWPGSPEGSLKVPRPERILIGFEMREEDVVKRLISAFEAEVTVNADIVDKEDDLTKYELIATIFPDGDGVLFDEQKSEVASA